MSSENSAPLFEAAADAVVAGDIATLERLLREHPDLARARSSADHRATLLHYVSANGVEDYRQKSPANAPAVAKLLLDAGAEVDADADVYGGGCTTLGLVATSAPPQIAGVQRAIIDVLLDHGARMDQPGSAGNRHALVRRCLANGQLEAAQYLVSRGAPLDFVGAAGMGRLDVVEATFETQVSTMERAEALAYACGYGHVAIVEFLLDHGMGVDTPLHLYGDSHTGLHIAAYEGQVDVGKLLVRRGASLDATDKTWGTPPVAWALTGWHHEAADPRDRYYEVVAALVAAGAAVNPDWFKDEDVRSDPRMLAALTGRV